MTTEIVLIRAGITNIYLLRGRGTVVVDPAGPPGGRIGSRLVLGRLGTPPRLDLIVLTHGHFDHVASAPRLRNATRAPIAIHGADAPHLRTGRVAWPFGVTRWARMLRATFRPLAASIGAPIFEPDLLLDDNGLDLEPYGVKGRVVHTPGHSNGSVSVVLASGDAIVGDLVMNARLLCRQPSFGIFADHPEQLPTSWQRLLDMGVHTVHPAHGRPFPVTALSSRCQAHATRNSSSREAHLA
jgi:glyoxylase-like metal-dependent hydrolase (beta-lactamase superfamily II)